MTAKKSAAQPPAGSVGTGTTGPGGTPTGIYWDRLNAAKGQKDLKALDEELATHGYDPKGQLRQAIAAKLKDL